MRRSSVILLLLTGSLSVTSCAKKDATPAGGGDSVLTKPYVKPDATPAVIDSGNGLIIDAAHIRTPEHEKLLARFDPLDVVHIYHDYRPLRKAGVPDAQLKTFLKDHKITKDELQAILEEGDMLGWKEK